MPIFPLFSEKSASQNASRKLDSMVNDTYRNVIFKASFFAANGAKTAKQAVDMATRDFLSRGINCIEYRDGKRVNIASYAQMAVRTASQRAYLIGEGSRRQEEGIPFIKITRHNTACELCRPFEGKILIDDVYSGGKPSDGDYMLLSQAMSAGLFHPNCRHGSSTHYPELDDFEYTPELEEEAQSEDRAEEEDERAKQAQLELLMQKYRRLVAGSLDEEKVSFYQAKLDELGEKQEKILDKSSQSDKIISFEVGRSLGAAAKNYPVKMPESRQHTKLAEGQKIEGIAFAGKGTRKEIRDRFRLEATYGIPADEWSKVSGKAYVIHNNKPVKAEVHWYEANGEIFEMKVKRFYDES